jgi:hypothetical protein
MKVYVTGHGLRPFKIEEEAQIENHPKQYKGKYLLPEGMEMMSGEKWVDLDYWFEESQIMD